ncbi:MAG: UDP-3-O-acyl-N-acetylglucosamine deacetylase, partial [Candidatus Cryptobacteroides sp.]
MTYQTTISKEYTFEGKGLHSGRIARMRLKPAPADTGILFIRDDIAPDAVIRALATNVSSTARSTTLTEGGASVQTIEHLLSALTGLGVDNVIVEIDNVEAPILDGSAKPYVEAITADGLKTLDAPRKYIEIDRVYEWTNPETGAFLRIEPAESTEYRLKIDFNSKVMGIQEANWNPSMDYAVEIGPC